MEEGGACEQENATEEEGEVGIPQYTMSCDERGTTVSVLAVPILLVEHGDDLSCQL